MTYDQVHTATDENDPDERPSVPAEDPVPAIAKSLAMPEEDVRTMTDKIVENIQAEQELKEKADASAAAMAAMMTSFTRTNTRSAAHRGQLAKAKAKRRAAKKARR